MLMVADMSTSFSEGLAYNIHFKTPVHVGRMVEVEEWKGFLKKRFLVRWMYEKGWWSDGVVGGLKQCGW